MVTDSGARDVLSMRLTFPVGRISAGFPGFRIGSLTPSFGIDTPRHIPNPVQITKDYILSGSSSRHLPAITSQIGRYLWPSDITHWTRFEHALNVPWLIQDGPAVHRRILPPPGVVSSERM